MGVYRLEYSEININIQYTNRTVYPHIKAEARVRKSLINL